jgi:hypothetical protein
MEGKQRVKKQGMGYSNNAVSKQKSKMNDNGSNMGKVTQFRNLDDIPNITEDDFVTDETNFPKYKNAEHFNHNQNQFLNNVVESNAISYREVSNPPRSNVSSTNSNGYRKESSPYEEHNIEEEDYSYIHYSVPSIPQRRHDLNNVDHQYSNQHDINRIEERLSSDDEDDLFPTPERKGPHQASLALVSKDDSAAREKSLRPLKNNPKRSAAAGATAMAAAPPLPCDMNGNVEKPLTEQEKLFFSKQPRAVEFK